MRISSFIKTALVSLAASFACISFAGEPIFWGYADGSHRGPETSPHSNFFMKNPRMGDLFNTILFKNHTAAPMMVDRLVIKDIDGNIIKSDKRIQIPSFATGGISFGPTGTYVHHITFRAVGIPNLKDVVVFGQLIESSGLDSELP